LEDILIFPPVTGNSVGKVKKTVKIIAQQTQTAFAIYPKVAGNLRNLLGGRNSEGRRRQMRIRAGMA